ncbi:polysaccharide biosynthesis/export family protein [Paracoccus aerius]|uniref:Polysaccharide biosynthesis/export family protein n=2 Tax=Paracoccus aerius TaxID=1915382 RepID=A0ABS1S3C8_9RHOB|nr:polysaccharide biosynthesis/export family protein [Paracoccus aerius]MBL3673218.1 polysaccharide biosynthesis/export family protein [Paracoccus aerius]
MRSFSGSAGTRRTYRAALFALCLGCCPMAAMAQVQPGDTLRVEVFDAPEFSREGMVGQDGAIALPLVGRIAVAGMDLEAAGRAIEGALKSQGLLTTPRLIVEIAVHRPVYVGGSVREPGMIAFVPGLTARQAIIAAGGMGTPGDTDAEKALSSVARREAVVFELSQLTERIARLEAEIGDGTGNAQDIGAEAAFLQDRLDRREQRELHTNQLLTLIKFEIDTLDRQSVLHEAEAALQQSDIEDARSLVQRGLAPRTRLQELLRQMSELNRDQLENRAYHARAQQGAETARYALADAIAAEREAARTDLAAAKASRAYLLAELKELDLQILPLRMNLQGSRAASPQARIQVHRSSGGETRMIEPSLDAPLEPGDVLEVSLVLSDPMTIEPGQ